MPESNGVQNQQVEMWPGRPYPLGATFDGTGVNFAALLRGRIEGRAVPDRRGRSRRRASS